MTGPEFSGDFNPNDLLPPSLEDIYKLRTLAKYCLSLSNVTESIRAEMQVISDQVEADLTIEQKFVGTNDAEGTEFIYGSFHLLPEDTEDNEADEHNSDDEATLDFTYRTDTEVSGALQNHRFSGPVAEYYMQQGIGTMLAMQTILDSSEGDEQEDHLEHLFVTDAKEIIDGLEDKHPKHFITELKRRIKNGSVELAEPIVTGSLGATAREAMSARKWGSFSTDKTITAHPSTIFRVTAGSHDSIDYNYGTTTPVHASNVSVGCHHNKFYDFKGAIVHLGQSQFLTIENDHSIALQSVSYIKQKPGKSTRTDERLAEQFREEHPHLFRRNGVNTAVAGDVSRFIGHLTSAFNIPQ